MMKKYITFTRAIVFCMVIIITFVIAELSNAANTPAPGSNDDPLVTKSYVDGQISSLKSSINKANSQISSLEMQIASLTQENTNLKTQIATLAAKKTNMQSKYQAVKAGKTILLQEGGIVVLYTGTATSVGVAGSNLSDLTTGNVIKVNQSIAKRHLILSAVTDPRGIKAKTDIFVLISGNYKIK